MSARRKTTSRGSGCREFLCYRGWSNRGIDDEKPVGGFLVIGIEAQRLAEEDRGGFVLVAPCGELAQQAIRHPALRPDADDVAEVGLGVEIAAQDDVGAGTDQEQGDALGLALERIGAHRDHSRKVTRLEQLRGGRDDSSIHKARWSKGQASANGCATNGFHGSIGRQTSDPAGGKPPAQGTRTRCFGSSRGVGTTRIGPAYWGVRGMLSILLLMLAIPVVAIAKPHPRQHEPRPAPDIWQRALEPHGPAVQKLLAKATEAIARADRGGLDWAIDQRTAYFVDAFHLLTAARELSPDNVDVLSLYAEAADEIGKTREALEALERVIRLVGPDKARIDVVGRLGAIKLRLGDRDAAIHWLRYTENASVLGNSEWLIYLATALAERGDVTPAIEALRHLIPSSIPYFNDDVALVAFSLAVLYDRDEQRGAAFDVLDHMQANLNQMYALKLQQRLGRFRFVPAADRHYYLALFYESLGEYIEARAEWALYVASGDSPWRARAIDHLAAIDAQRRHDPKAHPTQVKTK